MFATKAKVIRGMEPAQRRLLATVLATLTVLAVVMPSSAHATSTAADWVGKAFANVTGSSATQAAGQKPTGKTWAGKTWAVTGK